MSLSRRRSLTALSAAALAIAALAGCGSSSADLAQQEIIVLFEGTAPDSVRTKVRQACADLPGTSPRQPSAESDDKAGSGSEADSSTAKNPYSMRFRVDRATAAQRSQLYECLGRFDSVKGVKQPGM